MGVRTMTAGSRKASLSPARRIRNTLMGGLILLATLVVVAPLSIRKRTFSPLISASTQKWPSAARRTRVSPGAVSTASPPRTAVAN